MVVVYELLIGAGLVWLCWWLWRMGLGASGRNRTGLVLGAIVVAVFFGPMLWRADWEALARAGLVAVIVGAAALGYARLIARARRAARERDGGR